MSSLPLLYTGQPLEAQLLETNVKRDVRMTVPCDGLTRRCGNVVVVAEAVFHPLQDDHTPTASPGYGMPTNHLISLT
eukprot:8270931-Pyramimonas_sp.AAC.1